MSKDVKKGDTENQDINIEEIDEEVGIDSQKETEKCEDVTENKEPSEENKEEENVKEDYMEKLQRMAAEFDNYKKRTAREKTTLYDYAVVDTVKAILPAVDNLERAIGVDENSEEKQFKDGVILVYKQMIDILENLGITSIETVGTKFNPELHEAVMHIEDEEYGESEIVEEFQKGYILKNDKVVRHSMVKVAN